MSIKTVTDRECELEAELAEEQRINGMGAEREYVLQGQVTQLTRRVELCVQALVAREKELDELQYKLAANTLRQVIEQPVQPLTDERINLDIGAAAHDALISAVETRVKK